MESGIGFDLKALEVFVAIVETGGMAARGQRLGMTQSAVSQILVNFEQSRHVQLLDGSDDPVTNYPELYRRRIIREPFVLVLPRDFTEPKSSVRVLASSADFIRYSSSSVIGRTIERQLQQWCINAPLRLQFDNSFAILS